jgi:hypothetical protein
MEGLVGAGSMPFEGVFPSGPDIAPDSLVQRWLAFLFMAMMGMIGIAYLSAAVLAA